MKQMKITLAYELPKGKDTIYGSEEIIMPNCDTDEAYRQGKDRYLVQKLYNEFKMIFTRPQPVYVEVEAEEVEAPKDFKGYECLTKPIMELSWEELQDLAVLKKLWGIPLYRHGGLIDARIKAVELYQMSLGMPRMKARAFSRSSAARKLVVDPKAKPQAAPTPDEVVDNLTDEGYVDPQAPLDFEGLKALADEKGISYAPNIGEGTLRTRLEAEGHI